MFLQSARRAILVLMPSLAAVGCAAPWSPPTPQEILAKPSHAYIADVHFTVRAHITSGAFSVDMTGDGLLVQKPQRATRLHLQGNLGQLPLAIEQIEVGDRQYSRTGNSKWAESPASDASTTPDTWASGTDPKLVGEENLSLGRAWHLHAVQKSGRPFDVWIRESDGYPLRYSGDFSTVATSTSAGSSGSLVLDFDKFNTRAEVSVPPPSEIKPGPKDVSGKVGQPMTLNGVTVTVVQADLNHQPPDTYLRSKPGDRFVVVEVLYESTGTDKVDSNPYDWKLSDASGYTYDQTYTGIGPELHTGEVPSGGKARGFISYEAPQAAGGLMLKAKIGDDSVTVALG